MLGTFLFFLFAHFYTPFPDIHLAIRDTTGNIYLKNETSFPIVRGDGWDLNEEEAIGRYLFKNFALAKGYSIDILYKLRGTTYAEIQMSSKHSFETPVCTLSPLNMTEDVQIWYQGYGYSHYCST